MRCRSGRWESGTPAGCRNHGLLRSAWWMAGWSGDSLKNDRRPVDWLTFDRPPAGWSTFDRRRADWLRLDRRPAGWSMLDRRPADWSMAGWMGGWYLRERCRRTYSRSAYSNRARRRDAGDWGAGFLCCRSG